MLLTWIPHSFLHLWAVLGDGPLLRQALVAIRVALHLLLEAVVPTMLLLLHKGITMVIPMAKETLMATHLKANTKVTTITLPSTINATTMMARKVATGRRIVIQTAAILDRGETSILAVVTKDNLMYIETILGPGLLIAAGVS